MSIPVWARPPSEDFPTAIPCPLPSSPGGWPVLPRRQTAAAETGTSTPTQDPSRVIKEDGTPEWAGLDSIANVETCGVGDFNGDGIDDVLVRNGEWVGAWIVGTDGDASNGLVDSFIGIKGDLAADASIEQIADFNKDGIDDIVVRTAAGDLGVLVVKGSESTEWNYTAKLTLA